MSANVETTARDCSMTPDRLVYVSSAYNEALNLEELHTRCRQAFEQIREALPNPDDLEFGMVIADNNSSDESLTVLQRIVAKDPQVIGIANSSNYGPEASAVNAFRHAGDCSLMICLCSDLQDPPEQSVEMVVRLLQDNSKDAVLAVKSRSAGGPLLQMARRTYYKALGYSSRLQQVPSGFHGFGCYRKEVVEEILRYWDESGMNLRMCIANSCHSPVLIHYRQADRTRGTSSYRGAGYALEAIRALLSADAAASRLALTIGGFGVLFSFMVAVFLLANYLSGNSQYEGGIPTVMALILISFGLQMLTMAVVSRQIEGLRLSGFRPKLRYSLMRHSQSRNE